MTNRPGDLPDPSHRVVGVACGAVPARRELRQGVSASSLEHPARNAEGLPLATPQDGATIGAEKMITNLTAGPLVIPPEAGESFDFGGFGVHWKIDGHQADARFAVVHHPLAPRALAAPLHYHHREDEFSFVLSGTLGALLGDEVVIATRGTWLRKPRRQWHTFWNAGDDSCEIIEIISPAGFEKYFREVADAWGDLDRFAAFNQKYSLEMRFDSVPDLCRRFGVTFPSL
jgi:mannose-6-phosphate isomerase-like protein (cupin superfamily)